MSASQPATKPDSPEPNPCDWRRHIGQLDWLRWPEVWMYASFGLADVALTYILIGYYQHSEGNPIARYFIEGWGLKGMFWFKFGTVSLVLGIVHIVRQKQPRVALSLVRFGLFAVGLVVAYSLWLLNQSVLDYGLLLWCC